MNPETGQAGIARPRVSLVALPLIKGGRHEGIGHNSAYNVEGPPLQAERGGGEPLPARRGGQKNMTVHGRGTAAERKNMKIAANPIATP